jgi:hypothetical protein
MNRAGRFPAKRKTKMKTKKYIISAPDGMGGYVDFQICTLEKGNNLQDLRDGLKSHYRARLAKKGEGENLLPKHYSSTVLIFG